MNSWALIIRSTLSPCRILWQFDWLLPTCCYVTCYPEEVWRKYGRSWEQTLSNVVQLIKEACKENYHNKQKLILAKPWLKISKQATMGVNTWLVQEYSPVFLRTAAQRDTTYIWGVSTHHMVNASNLIAFVHKIYSGTSENGLPLLRKPPQCGQESMVPNYSLYYSVIVTRKPPY